MRYGKLKIHLVAVAAMVVTSGTTVMADEGSGRMFSPIDPCGTYQVRPGDTLGLIGSRVRGLRVSATDLFDLNRSAITSPDRIIPGQVIRIPCAPGAGGAPEPADPEVGFSWEARAGEGLVEVLVRWGRLEGMDVIVERGSDWRFGVPFRHPGPFRDAVDQAISGFSTAAVPPYVTFYTNNVMTIGAR
jgi:hypothetical protein